VFKRSDMKWEYLNVIYLIRNKLFEKKTKIQQYIVQETARLRKTLKLTIHRYGHKTRVL